MFGAPFPVSPYRPNSCFWTAAWFPLCPWALTAPGIGLVAKGQAESPHSPFHGMELSLAGSLPTMDYISQLTLRPAMVLWTWANTACLTARPGFLESGCAFSTVSFPFCQGLQKTPRPQHGWATRQKKSGSPNYHLEESHPLVRNICIGLLNKQKLNFCLLSRGQFRVCYSS